MEKALSAAADDRCTTTSFCIAEDHAGSSRATDFHHRVVTWYMGSGLKAQNMTGIRAQRKGLRAQKNGIMDHKAFEPESGIRFITRYKNLLSQYFPLNKVCVHSISWPRFIIYSCFRLAAVPVI